MKIESLAFKNGENIPVEFTGEGRNVSPSLIISKIPSDTKSITLICEDPDAEKISGKIWTHWILFNIEVKDRKIEINENTYSGLRGVNDFGVLDYRGPMPPIGSGKHRYFFRAYALTKFLNLEESASKMEVEKQMAKSILDKAEFYGTYSRI